MDRTIGLTKEKWGNKMKTGTGVLGLVLVCGLLLSGCSVLGFPDLEKEAAVKASNRLVYRGGPYTEAELNRIEIFSPKFAARQRVLQAVLKLEGELGPIDQEEIPSTNGSLVGKDDEKNVQQYYRNFINKAILSGDPEKINTAFTDARTVAKLYGHTVPFLVNDNPTSADSSYNDNNKYPADVNIQQHYRNFILETMSSGDPGEINTAFVVARAIAKLYGHAVPFLTYEIPALSIDDTEKQQTLTTPEAQRTPAQNYNAGNTVKPNAYGLGVNSDQYGRTHIYREKDGTPLSPIFQDGVKRNVYGPGVHQDQFGRPVYDSRP